MQVDPALGTPKDDVTHWAISRITGWRRNPTNKRVPIYERLSHPRPDGAHLGEWPLADCTLETIRDRWGHGEFRVHWLINDEEAADPSDRRRSAGNGNIFKLDEIAGDVVEEDPPTAAPVQVQPPSDGVTSQLDFAMRMMAMAEEKAHRTLQAILNASGHNRGDGGANAEVLAKLAEMTARLDAEKAQREVDERHRAELAKKDEEIRELKRAKEKAEEDADKAGDAPAFDPDVSIWEQLPVVAINGVMGLAKTHPEVAMGFVDKAMEWMEKRKAAKTEAVSRETLKPPTGAAPTHAIPRAVVQPPRAPVHVVPPRVVVDDPLTPSQTAKAADPPAPPRPPASSVQVAPQGP